MREYTVHVTQQVHREASVVVDAETEAEARATAIAAVEVGGTVDIEVKWDVVDPAAPVVIGVDAGDEVAPAAASTEPTITKVGNMIAVRNVQYKSRRRGGVVRPGDVRKGHHLDVVPGVSVRVFGSDVRVVGHGPGKPCTQEVKSYDTTFKIGDTASYGSYNLVYLGTIVAITKTMVVIEERVDSTRTKRHNVDFATFSMRHDFWDLEAIHRRNHDTMMSI